jgi:Cu-Zn family superoxide dismutase
MTRTSSTKLLLPLTFIIIVATLGCAAEDSTDTAETAAAEDAQTTAPDPAPGLALEARLESAAGQTISGIVTLEPQPDGSTVSITGEVRGLTPGPHGFHIHEIGDCSAPDFSSAGGHFAPRGHAHAGPDAPEHHAGDLGNIQASEEGVAVIETSSDAISLLEGDPMSVLGRAVVIHADADDLTSQPSGAAGGRVACGVLVERSAATP